MAGQHIVDVACKCWWQSDSSISPPPPSTLQVATHLPPQDTSNTSPTTNHPSFTAIHTLVLSFQCVMIKCPFSQLQLLLPLLFTEMEGDVKV